MRNVLKLVGGTAGSQVITVASAPILTRLYGPESFGVLAAFTSILALLNVMSSLRYELAIAVPEDDEEAFALLWLCFLLVAISTALTTVGVALLGNRLVDWLQQPALRYLLWMLPVGVLLTGLYQPLSYWAIRQQQFSLLAQTKLSQSSFNLITNILAAPLGTIGLLMGQIVSQSVGVAAILRQSSRVLWRGPKDSRVVLWKLLRQYSHFGLYSSPAGLINTIGNQVPNLIFASAFGMAELGQLALAQRLLLLPASLIGSAVSQVFLSKASKFFRAGKLPALLKMSYKKLFVYGVLSCSCIFFVVTPLVPLMFGGEWAQLGWIIPSLLPLFLGQLVVSPVSMALIISQQNMIDMLAQAGLVFIRVFPLIGALTFHVSFPSAVLSYSLGCFAGYVFYGACVWLAIRKQLGSASPPSC